MKIDFDKYPLLIPSIAISIMLFLAIPNLFPYSYYWGVRWIVTTGSIYFIYQAYKDKRIILIFLFTLTIFIFNPIFPIHFNKYLWRVFDLLAGILFFISIWVFTKERKMENDRKGEELKGPYKKKTISKKVILLISFVTLIILSTVIIIVKLNSGLSHKQAKEILLSDLSKISDKKVEALKLKGIKKLSDGSYWVKINYAYYRKMLPEINGEINKKNYYGYSDEELEEIAKKDGVKVENCLYDEDGNFLFKKWDTGWTFETIDPRKIYSKNKIDLTGKMELTPQKAKEIYLDNEGRGWKVIFDVLNIKEIKKLDNDIYWVKLFESFRDDDTKDILNSEWEFLYAKFDTGWFTDYYHTSMIDEALKKIEEKSKQSEEQPEQTD